MDRDKLIKAIENDKSTIDERERSIKNSSYIKGYEGGYIAIILIILIRSFSSDTFLHDLGMVISGQAIFMCYYLYKSGRNRKLNFSLIIFVSILFLIFTYGTLNHYAIIW